MAFAGPAANIPTGWALCDGTLLTRDANTQSLFDVIGVSWGTTDAGINNFRLPDFRGVFLRGLDFSPTGGETNRDVERNLRYSYHGGGNTGNKVGTYQSDDFGRHNHGLSKNGKGPEIGQLERTDLAYTSGSGRYSPSTDLTNGGAETRSKNAAVNYIIRVK
jgi:microcystin-dependent protein